ncbi:TetR/AcrR family transcriptional regulator [Sodalis sp. RH22]|uniref:TetR/AcrR family transcriptional regulator n=1 Tax=unclassified Sodalis (in: enterobacteria) TaxID=2636512 RepID=UPI0039B5B53A
MRYPAAETAEKHQRILQEAARLFCERGFSGVSVAEIMKATGLTHGPFYNHFASKEALMQESFEYRAQTTLAGIDEAAATPAGLLDYVDHYLSVQHRDNPALGCLVSALATEIAREETVRPSLTRLVAATVERLTRYFPWRSNKHARGDAIRLHASMVGGIILARAVNDEAFSREILREVNAGIQRFARAGAAGNDNVQGGRVEN